MFWTKVPGRFSFDLLSLIHIITLIVFLMPQRIAFTLGQGSLKCGFKHAVRHAVSVAIEETGGRVVVFVRQEHQLNLKLQVCDP